MKIKVASSKFALSDLLSRIGKSGMRADEAVQLFDPERVINRTHLEGAYLNALTAFKNKTNRSGNLGMEMLLFASMTNQIGDAIRVCGAKSNVNFVVFASSERAFSRISKLLSESGDFKPPAKHANAAAKRFGIGPAKDLDSFILQKMAVSRLGD